MHTITKAVAADILRGTRYGRMEALDEHRVLIAAPTGSAVYVAEYRLRRIAETLGDKGWKVKITSAGVEATRPTAVDVPFISPAMVYAARVAAALTERMGGPEAFTTLTIKVGLYGRGWGFHDALLGRAEGGNLIISPFREVDESSPFAEQSRRRFAAAEELRAHLAKLPFTGEALPIPLHAAH
jgi:hypothetical protein